MNSFDKEFITEIFLDTDSVSTMNRLVVAVANVVNENNENMIVVNEAIKNEFSQMLKHEGRVHISNHCLRSKDTFEDYDDEDYISRFKMKKSTVMALLNFLNEHNNTKNNNLCLEKKLHVFLCLLTSDSSCYEVGLLFGLSKSMVNQIFLDIAALLIEHRYQFVTWPSVDEQHVTRIKVNSRYKFPNCIGFIDTCRFYIGSKRKRKEKMNTVLLQAVCDESLMFIDVFVGEIGETKKSKVYKSSQLATELKNFVEFENHILGDSEYKLKKGLITPFSSEELLTSEEMKFNEIHMKVRSYIGNAFELLKERFKKLNHIEFTKPEYVNTLINSACVLHNFILLHEGCPQIKEELVVCDDGVTIDKSIVKTAIEKRQFLCNYVNFIDLEDTSFIPSLDE